MNSSDFVKKSSAQPSYAGDVGKIPIFQRETSLVERFLSAKGGNERVRVLNGLKAKLVSDPASAEGIAKLYLRVVTEEQGVMAKLTSVTHLQDISPEVAQTLKAYEIAKAIGVDTQGVSLEGLEAAIRDKTLVDFWDKAGLHNENVKSTDPTERAQQIRVCLANEEFSKGITEIKITKNNSVDDVDLLFIPPEIGLLSNVKEVVIAHQRIKKIPPEFAQLRNLEKLDMHGEHMDGFPPEVTRLTNLKELIFKYGHFPAISESIGDLTKLELLDLSFNDLTSLPPSASNLKKIETLVLDNNKFETVPPEVAKMSTLKSLQMSGNSTLKDLPDWLLDHKTLTNLYVMETKVKESNPMCEKMSNKGKFVAT